MKKPIRSEDKYWIGTNKFRHLVFEEDLEEYIYQLESQVTYYEMALQVIPSPIKEQAFKIVDKELKTTEE